MCSDSSLAWRVGSEPPRVAWPFEAEGVRCEFVHTSLQHHAWERNPLSMMTMCVYGKGRFHRLGLSGGEMQVGFDYSLYFRKGQRELAPRVPFRPQSCPGPGGHLSFPESDQFRSGRGPAGCLLKPRIKRPALRNKQMTSNLRLPRKIHCPPQRPFGWSC